MDEKQLEALLRGGEKPNVEYKREWYKLVDKESDTYKRQQGELIKDFLILANGNETVSGETAYLLIGVANIPNEDGKRDTYAVENIGDLAVLRGQILDWVAKYAEPALGDITPEWVLYDGKRLLVWSIPPSFQLHETTQRLLTTKRTYDEHAVLIRRGEATVTASAKERAAIQARKDAKAKESRKVMPTRFGPVIGAVVGGIVGTMLAPLLTPGDLLSVRLGGLIGGVLVFGAFSWALGSLWELLTDLLTKYHRSLTARILFWTVLVGFMVYVIVMSFAAPNPRLK